MLILFIFIYFITKSHSLTINIDEYSGSIVVEDEVRIECSKHLGNIYQVTFIGDLNIFLKIDSVLPLYFILHGWTESSEVPYIHDIADQLMVHTRCSVCTLDYRNLVKDDIVTSEKNAVLVGNYLAKFIKYLESKGFSNRNVNLVAHSLGAKVASECGRTLNGKIATIYALDPAAPGLQPNFAIYTQCVFTSFGLFRPDIGNCHANFYMNGGSQQPMCENSNNYYCSHQASHEYFLYSLDPLNKFYGDSCFINIFGLICMIKQKDQMGIYTQKKRGKFDCQTTNHPPYAINSKDMLNVA